MGAGAHTVAPLHQHRVRHQRACGGALQMYDDQPGFALDLTSKQVELFLERLRFAVFTDWVNVGFEAPLRRLDIEVLIGVDDCGHLG